MLARLIITMLDPNLIAFSIKNMSGLTQCLVFGGYYSICLIRILYRTAVRLNIWPINLGIGMLFLKLFSSLKSWTPFLRIQKKQQQHHLRIISGGKNSCSSSVVWLCVSYQPLLGKREFWKEIHIYCRFLFVHFFLEMSCW